MCTQQQIKSRELHSKHSRGKVGSESFQVIVKGQWVGLCTCWDDLKFNSPHIISLPVFASMMRMMASFSSPSRASCGSVYIDIS